MINFDLATAAQHVEGRRIGPDSEFFGLEIDSRRIEPRQLFVALSGERTDGHRFVGAAMDCGAAGVLVREAQDSDIPQIVVPDTLIALGRLTRAWRARFDIACLGITGSNGKTTVKSMVNAIVSRSRRCLVNQGNFNNEIGVPLTLARLNESHACAVIEMGAAKPGDIEYLAGIARPTIGLVTNAAPAHLQGMGTVEQVAKTKGELLASLPDDGIAIINLDDDHASLWRKLAGSRSIVTFGMQEAADVAGEYRAGGSGVRVRTPEWTADIRLRVRGAHNAANALAAIAAAVQLGAEKADIVAALEIFEPVGGRLDARAQPGGWLLLEDTYNANPTSVAAGISVLMEHPGERWLVLGDMAELGTDAEALHFQVGANARRMGVERLFAVGPLAHHAVQGFGEDGEHFDDKAALVDALRARLASGVICLIKGSRSARMEEVSAALTGEDTECC